MTRLFFKDGSFDPAREVVITGVKIPLRDGSGAQLTDINGKFLFAWELLIREGGR